MTFDKVSIIDTASLRSGTSLIEIMLAILIVSILLESAFFMASAERHILATAKDNVIALYTLESLRNKILVDIQNYKFDLKNMPEYTYEFKLPYRISWKLNQPTFEPENSAFEHPNSGWILELRLCVPQKLTLRPHSYIREVVLP